MKKNRRKPSPAHPPRKRGAQPHNSNAMKHGFYSVLFKDRERRLLDQMHPADLSAEIELIRITSVRFLEALSQSKQPGDYEANLTALRLVNLSAQSIAMLMRIQTLTGAMQHEVEQVFKSLEGADQKTDTETDSSPDAWGLVPSETTPGVSPDTPPTPG
jgi:hypothetical protein